MRRGNNRFARPHDNRFLKVHPSSFTHDCLGMQTQPTLHFGVDLENRHPQRGLNAYEAKPADEPVFGETEGVARVFKKRRNRAFALDRTRERMNDFRAARGLASLTR
jgi:hypothetical protein